MKPAHRTSRADEIVDALDAYIEKQSRELKQERQRLLEEGSAEFLAAIARATSKDDVTPLNLRRQSRIERRGQRWALIWPRLRNRLRQATSTALESIKRLKALAAGMNR
jgi:hypothetical protein